MGFHPKYVETLEFANGSLVDRGIGIVRKSSECLSEPPEADECSGEGWRIKVPFDPIALGIKEEGDLLLYPKL